LKGSVWKGLSLHDHVGTSKTSLSKLPATAAEVRSPPRLSLDDVDAACPGLLEAAAEVFSPLRLGIDEVDAEVRSPPRLGIDDVDAACPGLLEAAAEVVSPPRLGIDEVDAEVRSPPRLGIDEVDAAVRSPPRLRIDEVDAACPGLLKVAAGASSCDPVVIWILRDEELFDGVDCSTCSSFTDSLPLADSSEDL